jgi:hypothetical protein
MSEKFLLPNWLSIIPVVSVSFFIFIGSFYNSFFHKILSSKILEKIGLASFSIYLIHWVILSLYKYEFGFYLSLIEKILIFTLSIFLGILQFYFIENTFRYKLKNISFVKSIVGFIVIPFILLQCAYSYYKYSASLQKSPPYTRCIFLESKNMGDFTKCNFNSINNTPNIILTGDSYAEHILYTMEIIAKKVGFGFSSLSYAGCAVIKMNNGDHIYYIDFNNIVCSNQDSCKIMVDNNLLYHDDRHFSSYGSKYIGSQYIKGQIDKVFYKMKVLYKDNNKNLNIHRLIKQYKADLN